MPQVDREFKRGNVSNIFSFDITEGTLNYQQSSRLETVNCLLKHLKMAGERG